METLTLQKTVRFSLCFKPSCISWRYSDVYKIYALSKHNSQTKGVNVAKADVTAYSCMFAKLYVCKDFLSVCIWRKLPR